MSWVSFCSFILVIIIATAITLIILWKKGIIFKKSETITSDQSQNQPQNQTQTNDVLKTYLTQNYSNNTKFATSKMKFLLNEMPDDLIAASYITKFNLIVDQLPIYTTKYKSCFDQAITSIDKLRATLGISLCSLFKEDIDSSIQCAFYLYFMELSFFGQTSTQLPLSYDSVNETLTIRNADILPLYDMLFSNSCNTNNDCATDEICNNQWCESNTGSQIKTISLAEFKERLSPHMIQLKSHLSQDDNHCTSCDTLVYR